MVKVKKDVAPGTEIVNTAKARVEGNPWVEESVTNRAADADRKVTIKKTNNKGNSGTEFEYAHNGNDRQRISQKHCARIAHEDGGGIEIVR